MNPSCESMKDFHLYPLFCGREWEKRRSARHAQIRECDFVVSIERVRAYFAQWNIQDRIREFDVSSATVELAAQALGCPGQRIAKTLSFRVADGCVLIVMAGDMKVDNSKFKAVFHAKAKMLTHEEAEQEIGHAVGGVCPFAVNEGVKVYLDESLRRFETVFPACGSSNSAIELTCEELEKYSACAGWIDVSKEIAPN